MIERGPEVPEDPVPQIMVPDEQVPSQPTGETAGVKRVLGRYEAGRPGPLVLVVGGVHGNEPAGVFAARRVLGVLEEQRLPMRGKLIAVAGNLRALERGERYLDTDLNRLWREEQAQERGTRSEADVGEQEELLDVFGEILDGEPGEVCVLDLHSSSAHGSPFSILADTLQNRRIATALPIPAILGLEENLDGTLLGHFGRLGCVAIAIEGGQHTAPETVRNHEAAIWLALVACGALDASDVPDYDVCYEGLAAAASGLPRVIETRYRHSIDSEDRFEMNPGFDSFTQVKKGQVLARDRQGVVVAPEDGLVLLPLYQGQGNDGFFLGRQVGASWLALSSLLRKLHIERFLTLLPGIRRDREADGLVADVRVARWFAPELFNLLGYRIKRVEGQELRLQRRRERRQRKRA